MDEVLIEATVRNVRVNGLTVKFVGDSVHLHRLYVKLYLFYLVYYGDGHGISLGNVSLT